MVTILQFIQRRKTLITLLCGGLLGLLLGLAIGWWWWPVEWTNSTPGNLRQDFQSDYLVWVADQYARTGDLDWVRSRLGAEYWKEGQLAQALEGLAAERGGAEASSLRTLAQALAAAPAATPAASGTTGLAGLRSVAMVCGAALLVVAFVGAAVFLISRLRSAGVAQQAAGPREGRAAAYAPTEEEVSWGIEGPPLAQFTPTYVLGDDHFDPSFSIELESGEFMGECGLGISETIGVGAPSKVTAFEVWLFDKNDIRTVTKVIMSDYAFNDEALHAKLAPKGEPVLARAGTDVVLETKSLRLRARVVEATYGVGNLPPNSFFERLTIDLAAWGTAGPAGASFAAEPDLPTMPFSRG